MDKIVQKLSKHYKVLAEEGFRDIVTASVDKGKKTNKTKDSPNKQKQTPLKGEVQSQETFKLSFIIYYSVYY